MDTTKELLKNLICGFVNNPEAVELYVDKETDDKGEVNIIHVKVDKDDVGICIGSSGTTAEALRKIVGLIGFKQLNGRVYVKIDAPKIPKDHFSYETAK